MAFASSPRMFLVDTNVVSEFRKGIKANPGIRRFREAVEDTDVHLCVQTIGEIRSGIESVKRRGNTTHSEKLEVWLDKIIEEYGGRILSFDAECAQVWGKLMSADGQNPVDKQIASIGLIYGLTVVTRDVGHFAGTGVSLNNPFL